MNKRLGTGLPFKPGHRKDVEIFLDETMLLAPLHWKKPRCIFLCSMTDAFADFVKDEWLDRMFAVMALTPQHRYQVLTKRAARMREWVGINRDRADRVGMAMLTLVDRIPYGHRQVPWPLPNVWLGVSAEDQQRADERIPLLLETPAAVRFVSLEPLLGPISLADAIMGWAMDELRRRISEGKEPELRDGKLDWVIVGGESGPNARPMRPDWVFALRDQCHAAGVPFFFKQWGGWNPVAGNEYYDTEHGRARLIAQDGTVHRFIETAGPQPWLMRPSNKKAAGRLLDGIEHNGMPA